MDDTNKALFSEYIVRNEGHLSYYEKFLETDEENVQST